MLVAMTMQMSSAKDKNPIIAAMSFYGVIQEIWKVSYNTFKVVLFKCDWVENHYGVRMDDLGFTWVDLSCIEHTSDLFIMATQAKQVFYVGDHIDARWSIVVIPLQKDFADSCLNDDLRDTSLHCPAISKWTISTSMDESEIPYTRDDCKGTWVNN